MPERKALTSLKIIDEAAGTFRAVFATLNVIDKDGDVTLAGEFRDGQKVRVSAYNHASWDGALPIGKGVIHEIGDEAIVDGQFFMQTAAGKDTFTVVKELGDLAEWSYGFDAERKRGVFGPNETPVTFLSGIEVHEVSPVILGAGINTRTLAMKQLTHDLFTRLRDAGAARWGSATSSVWVEDFDVDQNFAVFAICSDAAPCRYARMNFTRGDGGTVTLEGDESAVQPTVTYNPKSRGRKLHEHAASVLTDFDALVGRVNEVVQMRRSTGKTLGTDTQEALERFEVTMKRLRDVLTTEPHTKDDEHTILMRELARIEARRATTLIS